MSPQQISMKQVALLHFGPDVSARLVDDLLKIGSKSALIVTTPPVRDAAERVAGPLRSQGLRTEIWCDSGSEPSVSDFEALLAMAQSRAADAVIGIGGGSSMDLAKLAAALLDGRQTIADVQRAGLSGPRRCWLACIPTTAGTGSEVSPIAILLDENDLLKKGVVSEHLVPDAAYIDPMLTKSMPPAVTAATGLDALTHCIEAYANRFAHPVIDTFALEGVRLVFRSLLNAVRNGNDVQARTDMARASFYGGLCLGPVNTAAVHALAYPLGGEFHVAHGVSNAILLPHVLAFNLPAAEARYADIAMAAGADGNGTTAEIARAGLRLIEGLCRDCGVPMRLSDHGVPADALDRMTDGAMTVTRLLDRNVRPVEWRDARQIYDAAF
ncbi:alcohol dehydrogenase class IV [Sphingobium sp. B11D3B]|uniref:iron-containing alcohol dehydrogenase n=1 Tax=Sphingobium sp. B11D3B TaxID=2940575 RepID=UPI0022277954|nr:iron-containing alcohol dehydrogenase [Sphingobium sp. B11D3B]MCW2389289.1 alcohol dehydrogenase class IV [Sphingobium sp. B11D3B]